MELLKIKEVASLSGSINISGAKNASLPLLAMSLISKNSFKLSNIPDVVDINTFLELLELFDADCNRIDRNSVSIDASHITKTEATYEIVKKMRASILVFGPLLSRFGKCKVSLPGGCAIGARPVDMHIKAMEKMGADIHIENGYIVAEAKNGLLGSEIVFDKITVTGTENVILAAALARGTTKIINAAKEPEVEQICLELQKAGIEIKGIGTSEIEIVGTDREPIDFKEEISVIPDRIEAGTYLCAGAITNSSITLNRVNINHIESIISKLTEIGFSFDISKNSITIKKAEKLKPFSLITTEYPGFPTDMQAQFMALATQCEGVSKIEERLFENRFMHVSELNRLGASIELNGNTAFIKGRTPLKGAEVMATDLRASSSLVLAALIADGETSIHRIYHLDRGYEDLENKLKSLGVITERLTEE